MFKFYKMFFVLCLFASFSSCNDDTVTPSASGYKGTIYFSSAEVIYKIELGTVTKTTLFSNAREPEMTKSGKLLVFEYAPAPGRLIYSDLTGANRTALLVGNKNVSIDFKHRWYISKPRISYDQKYVAYDGTIQNPNTYIIDSQSGDLIASIGDYNAKSPFTSPSWFPDGSLVVAGEKSMNNGIYKVTNGFKTVTRLDPNLSNVTSPSVSPDGTKIVFIKDEKLWTMNADGSNPKQIYTSTERFYTPIWSPDSKYIAAVDYLGHIFIVDPIALTALDLNFKYYVGLSEQLSWVY